MAKGAGLVLVGVAGLVLLASAASGAEPAKKGGTPPEPKPPEPKPPVPGARCERTQPGDGKKNGRSEAVRAWQKCLVDSGCLAPDQVDGEHGPRTEAASRAYETSGGKCAAPAGGGAPASDAKTVLYTLAANILRPNGEQAYSLIDQVDLPGPVKKADEKGVLARFEQQAESFFTSALYPGERDGEYVGQKKAGGKTTVIWQKTKKAGGGSSGGDLIA